MEKEKENLEAAERTGASLCEPGGASTWNRNGLSSSRGCHNAGDYRNIIMVPVSAPGTRCDCRIPLSNMNTGTVGKKGNGEVPKSHKTGRWVEGQGGRGRKRAKTVEHKDMASMRVGVGVRLCLPVPVSSCRCAPIRPSSNKSSRRPGTTWSGVTGTRRSRRREGRPNKDLNG